MFREIFLFEIRLHLKRISTYIYFAIWFSMALLWASLREFGAAFGAGGKVFANSPYILAYVMSTLTAFGLVIISAIFGTSIYRDFEQETYQMFFTKPLKKIDYLGGRWLGSFVITALIFSGLIFGLMIGKFMPWADQARLMPIDLWFHWQPFLLFVITDIFFAGALFFTIGALTRNAVFVYLQAVVFLGLYLILLVVVANNSDTIDRFWSALLDPFALITSLYVARYWTIAEKNSMVVPFAGVMAYNRLLWMGIGALALIALFRFFPFSAEGLVARRARGRVTDEGEEERLVARALPSRVFKQRFDSHATRVQFLTLTRLRVTSIIKEVPFIAMILIGMVFVFIGGQEVGRVIDTPVLPVTYLVTEMVKGQFFLLLVIITTLYAGELVWKERNLKFDQIHDTLPTPGWLNFASQLTALTVVQAALLVVMILSGLALQALLGYYRFELNIYLTESFLILLPNLIQYSALALLLQTLLPNKFLGHAIMISLFIILSVMEQYGFENNLYQFGGTLSYIYSDMNGYGHFVRPILWYTVYWTLCAGIMGVIAILFTRRGTDLVWRSPLNRAARQLHAPLIAFGAIFFVAFTSAGGYIFYNTHRLNRYEDSEARRRTYALYEKRYKQYEDLPQPKITAVELKVDIFPERRAFEGSGSFMLVNKTERAIASIHISDAKDSLKRISFDRQFTETTADRDTGYYVYQFAEPLKPAERVRLDFNVGYENKGFRNGEERNEFADNGTFFDNLYFPLIGYDRDLELSDDDERRDQDLSPQADMPSPDDPGACNRMLFAPDSDRVNFKATVSTAPDQIAVAPGYLQREWIENGRRYFAYDMGEKKIVNFYAFVSGRYAVKRDTWFGPQGDVKIEVYYHPQHEYNVDRMIESTKKGLDYYTENFGPYQFKQFRILEFPRYQDLAQSFPNTIPYSEGIGFIAHATKEDGLDTPFYVTAHELAHQWWGEQVVGCYAQGSNMLSETLAQYSALMVMEKEVGRGSISTYLVHELDRYLQGRSAERKQEVPLAFVQDNEYIWYYKGSLVMYALKDYLGEDRLNAALRRYLDAVKFQEAPYTTSLELIDYLRAATPDDQQQIITDLFETITLFDNRAVEATYRETFEKRYVVKLKVDARKLRADGLGAENEIAIDDLIDIGIYGGEGEEKTLFLEKRRITQPRMEFEITVDQIPTRAGIDPYYKLIDREPDNNLIPVTKY
jgi:ABC-2 type transport system permease protein